MAIQDEIKQLAKQLLQKVDELQNKEIRICRYKPEYNEGYYLINALGHIIYTSSAQTDMDNYLISIGGCFKTEAQAEKHKRILINKQKLKDLADQLNNNEELDWNDDKQTKYYIVLDGDTPVLDNNWSYKCQGAIYCLDNKFLNKAIEEIGKEGLVELIKDE